MVLSARQGFAHSVDVEVLGLEYTSVARIVTTDKCSDIYHVKRQVTWLEQSDSNLKPHQQEAVPLHPLGSSHVLLLYSHQPTVLTGTCLTLPSFPLQH